MEKLQPVTEFTAQDRLRLVKYCNSIVRNVDLAEDLAQDAMLRATEKQQQFQGKSQYIVWVHSIARNLSFQYFRRLREVASLESAAPIADSRPTATDTLCQAQLYEQLRAAVASMSEVHRQVIELYFYQDLNSTQIAKRLGISCEAAKGRIHQAKIKLRQRMVN